MLANKIQANMSFVNHYYLKGMLTDLHSAQPATGLGYELLQINNIFVPIKYAEVSNFSNIVKN